MRDSAYFNCRRYGQRSCWFGSDWYRYGNHAYRTVWYAGLLRAGLDGMVTVDEPDTTFLIRKVDAHQ